MPAMKSLVTLLWDRGFSFEDIKDKTGIPLQQISDIVKEHCETDSNDDDEIGYKLETELED